MKRFLQIALLPLVVLFTSFQANAQSSGIFESYAILSLNGGANAYYDMQAVTGNPDLQGSALGSFTFGTSTLVVKGGQNKTYKNGGCNINGSNILYRVFKVGDTPGSFTTINEPFAFNIGGSGDQQWEGTAGTTNAIAGLLPGSYTLEVYSTAGYDSCGSGTHFSNNSGANYKASFTIIPNPATPIIVTSATGTGSPTAQYTTVAAAVTAINAGVLHTGTIVCYAPAGYTETTPIGGISITATGTVSAPITFVKSGSGANPTFTAPAQTAAALNDAIFKIIGGDYITIDGFTMLERVFTPVAADTAAGTNTMTEFSVALFYATTTNGCQNVTIKNCTIDLNRTYQNTFGIYANSTHSATNMTSLATATSTTGGNHNLTITGNSITDVNNGIVIVGPTAVADQNDNVVIGGSALNANTITNFGTTGTFSGYISVSGTVNGVLVRNTKNTTISNNTITSSVGGVTAGTLNGIQIPASSTAPTGTFTVNINNNSISLKSGLIAGAMNGINLPSGSATTTSILNINANDFNNFGHTVSGTGAIIFITNAGTHLTQSISNNTFTNITVNTTGSVTFISNSNTVAAGGSQNMNSNAIVTAFNKTGAGGTVTFLTSAGSSLTGVTSIWNLNNFSNVTVTGATTIAGITSTDGGTVNHNITNNTITNITGGTSIITGINSSFGGGGGSLGNVVSGNTINTISSTGQIVGISIGSSGTISSVFNNTINGLVSTGASSVQGITSGAPTSNSIYQNKIYNLEANNASGSVNGIAVSAGTLHTIYNNIIGDLRTPISNAANPLIGINITGGTTVNAYHNTVRLAGTSSGALFGSSGISVSTTPSVTLRNNIFINNSSFTGAGLAVAYRRSSTTLTTYNAASDNNLYYAGTPGANNLIFTDGTNSDQTLAAFKTRMATRDQASQTENVTFQSTTGSNANFLRIAAGTTTYAESGAVLITSPNINTDYWGVTRPFISPVNGGTAADIGASEFDGIPSLVNCIAPIDQATAFVAGAKTSTTAAATFTAATSVPTGYLVLASVGTLSGTPVDGTGYTTGATLGNGTVIQSSNSLSIAATALVANTTYTFTIFSYNSGSCAGGPKYNLTSPLTAVMTTCAATPTVAVTTAITGTGFTANWTANNGGSAFTTTYSVEVTTDAGYTTPIAGSPFTTTSASQAITGLSPQTNYYWRVKANNTICDSAYLSAGLVTTDCVAITSFPNTEPFATYLPTTCWKEGDLGDLTAGPTTIGASVSDWIVDGFLNSGTTGAAKMNIDTATGSEWILSPFYTIPATGYRVKYNVGATNFGATTAVTNWEADDFVELLVSTGTTNWTVLRTYNSSSVPSNLGQLDEVSLSAYNGQTVRFAFRAFEGATNGAADIDFFIDDFTVDLVPVAITVSSSVTICAGDSTTLTVSSANTNYAYTWSPASGLNTTTGATVIASPTSTTTYTVNAVDGAMNNTGTVTVTVNPKPTASTAGSNSPICEGSNLNLTASTVTLSGYSVNGNSGVAFTDISTTGTAVTAAGDDSEHNITIPSFTYNGVAYTTARIGNNGVLVFGTTTGDIIYTNSALPQGIASSTSSTTGIITGSGNSLAAICANWDDMTPSTTTLPSNIYTETVGGMYIIQWNNEDNFGATGTGTVTFQIQLEIATGIINLVYPDITYGVAGFDGSQTATVGLNFSASSAQQYSFNSASLVDNQSITFTPNTVNYSWAGPNSFTSSVQNPTISAATTAATGTYTLTVTNPTTGCFATSTTNVTVDAQAVGGSVTGGSAVCSGSTSGLLTLAGHTGTIIRWESTISPFTTWTPIANTSTTYTSGVLSETTQFRAVVKSGTCPETTSGATTVTLSVTTWTAAGGGSWSNGTPTGATTAIISANYTSAGSGAGSFSACTLTVDSGAVVIIASGDAITLNGAITVSSGSFTLNDTANLIQNTTVANSGNISVKRTTAALMRQDYVLWSSPVAGQQLQSFSPMTLATRFYTYNPSSNIYVAVGSPSTTNFTASTGYLIRVPNNHPVTPLSWTGTFTGVPNNGDSLGLTGLTSGLFYATGNPYPSAINANAFITSNSITDPLYFWRKTNNTVTSSYATYTTAGGVSNSPADPLGLIPNGFIQAGQGFIAKAANSALNFTNSMRLANSGPLLRTIEDRNRIWLDLNGANGAFGQMMVAYMPGATAGIDGAIDGRFFGDSQTALTSTINNEDFIIQGRALPFETTDVVALGFKSELAGSYTISINHVDGLFETENQNIYLKDNLANITTDLRSGSYTFATEAGVFNSRFEIVYTNPLAVNQNTFTENSVVIYKQNQDLVINTGKVTMATVKVFDIQGRLLVEKKHINASETKINVGTTNQVLIVKIDSESNGTVTKKVVN